MPTMTIVARQNRYIKAWTEGSVETLMQFIETDEFGYFNFGQQRYPQHYLTYTCTTAASVDCQTCHSI